MSTLWSQFRREGPSAIMSKGFLYVGRILTSFAFTSELFELRSLRILDLSSSLDSRKRGNRGLESLRVWGGPGVS